MFSQQKWLLSMFLVGIGQLSLAQAGCPPSQYCCPASYPNDMGGTTPYPFAGAEYDNESAGESNRSVCLYTSPNGAGSYYNVRIPASTLIDSFPSDPFPSGNYPWAAAQSPVVFACASSDQTQCGFIVNPSPS